MTEDEYLQLIYIIHITIIYNQFWKKKSDQPQSNENYSMWGFKPW